MTSLGLKVEPLAIWVVSSLDLRGAVPVLLNRHSDRTRPAILSHGLQMLGVQHQPDVRLLRHRHRSPQILQVHRPLAPDRLLIDNPDRYHRHPATQG